MIGALSSNPLSNAQQSLQTSTQRLASGQRLHSAKDDAAAVAIAASMVAQLRGTDQATRNVYDGLSLTDTAGGALGQVSDSLQRMRELAVQAANGTNSASDIQSIQGEINQLAQGLNDIAGSAQFNGQNLLDGSFSAQLQTGANAGDTYTLALGNASISGLGIGSIDVTTPAGAAGALDSLDSAINVVGSMQSHIGAAQAGLNSELANLTNTYDNLAAAKSRIADTDYAQESSNQALNQARVQASTKALAIYNSIQGNELSLLKR
ncbi:MAG TPA: flagellin [Rhodocyclaceae bacterium]|nr:flagellin [Rhodocyclaceae bacterium]